VALVRMRGPLKQLAGGVGEHEIPGAVVAELLSVLEQRHPALRGWIVDERGRIRHHINVFINGDRGREQTPVAPEDLVDIIPAISGGARP
jgi:sulfur-carrier protein